MLMALYASFYNDKDIDIMQLYTALTIVR